MVGCKFMLAKILITTLGACKARGQVASGWQSFEIDKCLALYCSSGSLLETCVPAEVFDLLMNCWTALLASSCACRVTSLSVNTLPMCKHRFRPNTFTPYISLCVYPTALPSVQLFLWLLLYALAPFFFGACVCYLQYSFLNSKQQMHNYGYKACRNHAVHDRQMSKSTDNICIHITT